MRSALTLYAIVLFAAGAFAQDKPESPANALASPPVAVPSAAAELATPKQKVSYAFGMSIGRNLQQRGLQLDLKSLALGIATILDDTEPLLSPEEIQAASVEYDAFMAKEQEKLAVENKAAAVRFLTQNAKKEGVKQTKSGMQYIVLQEGNGKTPKETDTVSTHYRGTLISGKMFDQSYEGTAPTAADKPVSFPVNQVIDGWTEALQMMKVGAKYRLFVPPELAYGESGPASIGPHSLLIFDIELLDVKPTPVE